MNSTEIVLLDCTLRDGGYYNSWDFDIGLVNRYLRSIESSGIDAIEMGFRLTPKKEFLGPFAFTTDDMLNGLSLPNCKIGVMVNSTDMINHELGPVQCIKNMFSECENSPVDFVRIASHFSSISEARVVADTLCELGYFVCFNCMQAAGRSEKELSTAAKEISSWNAVDVLYYADSLGDMNPDSTNDLVRSFRQEWDGPIGSHTHNNKGIAVINSLTAMSAGATWIDGTVLGMGRGAGNALTEYLLVELNNMGYDKYNIDGIFTIVMEDFKDLMQQYKWGPNILYYLSAISKVHPTYVQEMIGSLQYNTTQLMDGINVLSQCKSNSYHKDKLDKAMSGDGYSVSGSWSSSEWTKDRDVLIIANGPSVKKHKSAIESFIKSRSPFVIGLNCNIDIDRSSIDAYAVCHFTRLLTELDKYRNLKKSILIPWSSLNNEMKQALSDVDIFDYGIHVKQGCFEINETGCTIPFNLVAPYVFSAVTFGGANRILLAGFDGYETDNRQQKEMVEVIEMYKSLENRVPIISIMPSSYPVEMSSLYSPVV